jgi:hypothetical protein
MSKKAQTRPLHENPQPDRFVEAARALGCDEDEAKFNAALGKVARHKPPPDPPKASAPKKDKAAR